MAPLDFKHMTSAKYRPGEDDAINYYAQKRKKQYHGNEGKEVKELSMKPDKKLPNLKVPAKGKKGISKFMRKKLITKTKDDVNASVQSADRKPEKYMKPDGKVGIRMVKTDKEVVKKEASVLKPKSAMDIVKHARTLAKNPRDYMMNRKKYIDKARAKVFKMYPKEEVDEATWPDEMPKDIDEALTLQQRMKRSRLMKRLKTKIKIGRQRAMRKMANKKTLEKRAMRQARNDIAKKLTRGIPKRELTFARKQEIEKRLEKPALQQRIKRIAKRLFKDVRKKEVQRKKG